MSAGGGGAAVVDVVVVVVLCCPSDVVIIIIMLLEVVVLKKRRWYRNVCDVACCCSSSFHLSFGDKTTHVVHGRGITMHAASGAKALPPFGKLIVLLSSAGQSRGYYIIFGLACSVVGFGSSVSVLRMVTDPFSARYSSITMTSGAFESPVQSTIISPSPSTSSLYKNGISFDKILSTRTSLVVSFF